MRIILILILVLAGAFNAADAQTTKLSDLPEATSPGTDTITYGVINPSTSPADRKITIENLVKSGCPTASVTVKGCVFGTSGSSILSGNSSGGFSNVTIGTGLTFSGGTLSATGGAGLGTVTSVGGSFTGGLISVAGSPITTSGTLALSVSGTSGGIPYFSSNSTWASSGALTANMPVIGGGAGAAPTVGTRSGNTTQFGTVTGTKTTGKQLAFDASGNIIASASDIGGGGGGSGTINSGTTGQLAIYSGATTLDSTSVFSVSGGIASVGDTSSKYFAPNFTNADSGSTSLVIPAGGTAVAIAPKDCDALNAGDVVKSISSAGVVGCATPAGGGGTSVTAASTFGSDNRVLRSDGTGRGAQASGIVIDDSDNIQVGSGSTGSIAAGTVTLNSLTASRCLRTDGSKVTASATGDCVVSGAATSSGLTMATSRLIGRTTASTGALEEITVGTGLSFSAGSLANSGVLSVAKAGSAALTGAVTLTGGTNVTLTQSGNDISIAASGGGSGCSTSGSNDQVLTDNGSGGCASEADATIASGVLTLGTAGSVVGEVAMKNATSGTVSIKPVTGALGTVTLSAPARTATLATTTGTLTSGNCAKFDASGNLIDHGTTCGGGGGVTWNRVKVRISADVATTTSAGVIAWDTDINANASMHSTSTNNDRIVIPQATPYCSYSLHQVIESGAATTANVGFVYLNSTATTLIDYSGIKWAPGQNLNGSVLMSNQRNFNNASDDYITVSIQSIGGAGTLKGGQEYYTTLAVECHD